MKQVLKRVFLFSAIVLLVGAAALASAGPMGLALLDYLIHRDERPSLLVCTDIDEGRLARAAQILSPADAKEHGVELVYINTGNIENPV